MLLAQHAGVAALQQSSFFERIDFLAKWIAEQARYGRTVLTSAAAGGDDAGGGLQRRPLGKVLSIERFYQHVRPLAAELYGMIAACAPDTLAVVDHHPENVRYWRHILAVFPDAWFVHVIRDPRSVFSSYRHAATSFSSAKVFTRDPAVFAREWSDDVERALAIAGATDRYVGVHYETLREGGGPELQALYARLGLAADREQSERAFAACAVDKLQNTAHGPAGFFRKGEVGGWRRELTRAQVAVLEYECAALMDRLGYARTAAGPGRKPWQLVLRDLRRSTLGAFQRWARDGDGWAIRGLRRLGRSFPRTRKLAWRLIGR